MKSNAYDELLPLVSFESHRREADEISGAYYLVVAEYRTVVEEMDSEMLNPGALAVSGKSFDFWDEPGEDIYSTKET